MIVVCMITITGRNRKAFRPKTLPPRNFQKCLVPWCPRSILLFPVLLDKLKIVPPYKYILLTPLHHYRHRLHSTKKCILESSAKYILSFNCKPSTIHPLWAFSSMVEFSGKIISKRFQLTLNNCKLVSQWRRSPNPGRRICWQDPQNPSCNPGNFQHTKGAAHTAYQQPTTKCWPLVS